MTPQLCLGTAQFGLPYGITNTEGQVPESEVAKLLAKLEETDFRWLDTAHAYGNAEEVIGRNLWEGHSLRIITKLPAQPQVAFTGRDAVVWEQAFQLSCERLGVKSLNALLLHAPSDLSKPGSGYLEDWLLGLKQRGLVDRLGMSIYTADDLEAVAPDLLDIVQLPLSLYDQRLLQDGTVDWLRRHGAALHARSIFLQGLLLTPVKRWPIWASCEARAHQQELEGLAKEKDCHLIDLALGFAKAQTSLEAVVVGICRLQELADLRRCWSRASSWQPGEMENWALDDPITLDPRRWPGND